MPTSPPPDTFEQDKALAKLYNKRVKANQDLFVIVSDWHNRRGTGKTIASLRLAHTMDRTEEGFTIDKATLSVPELTESYVNQPKGSALVLDEAEAGVSKYEAGTSTNKAIRKLVSMGRIEEKYVIMNLPNSGEMDRDLKALSDVWIIVTARGSAKCNIMGYNPWGEHPIVDADHRYAWDDIPSDHYLSDVYQELTREKRARLRGEGDGAQMMTGDELNEEVEAAKESAETQQRNKMIQDLYQTTDLTQQDIADLDTIDLSRSRVADIVGS